jgi:hypothetical protein
MPAQTASYLAVHFTPLVDDSTSVVLTQSNGKAFESMAELTRSRYGSSRTLTFGQHFLVAGGG